MKETFYFPHDYNAHSDEKVLRLRREKGLEGYGIYWYLIELLASSSEGRLPFDSLEDIAFEMRSQCECIASVVRAYKLFQFDDEFFWSNRLISSIKEREEKSEKAKKAAKTRWMEANKNANAMQPHSERNATAMLERKGKDRIEKKERIGEDPLFQNFKEYISNRGIKNEIKDDRYLEMRAEYEQKLTWWTEARACIDWCYDNEKKILTAARLRNWMKNCIKYNHEKQLKQQQKYEDKKVNPKHQGQYLPTAEELLIS